MSHFFKVSRDFKIILNLFVTYSIIAYKKNYTKLYKEKLTSKIFLNIKLFNLLTVLLKLLLKFYILCVLF